MWAMSYPTIYDVSYSYTGFQAALGDGSFPGTQLDADMAGLSDSVASINAFIQTAFRSDGVLKAASLPGTDPILQYVDEAAAAAAAEATEIATAAATSAVTSETQAATSASAAQTARTGAETAQTAAAASATAAATSAGQALAYRDAAAQSAVDAQNAAEQAALFGGLAWTPYRWLAAGGETVLAFGEVINPARVDVVKNGSTLQSNGADYALSTTELTLTEALVAGDVVEAKVYASFAVADALQPSQNLADLSSVVSARANLGLGSAASKDVGTAAGQLVELLADGKLPAVDGSLLTGILAGGIKNVRLIAASGGVTPSAGTTNWVGFIVDGGNKGGGSGGSSDTSAGGGCAGGKGSVYFSPVSPSNTYPVTIGAVGGATSVVINDTTYTSTNGLLKVPARPGDSAMPKTAVRGGRGGDGPFGLGGGGPGASSPTGAGDRSGGAATGYGAGGGGSAKGSSYANSHPAGGAGAPGCLWLWEFQ